MKTKFRHITCIYVDIKSFNEEKVFSESPYYEKLDPEKEYDTKSFEKDYGEFGLKRYVNSLCEVIDKNTSETIKYMVTQEMVDPKELKDLKKYCECEFHQLKWYNSKRYSICKICVQCLYSDFPAYHLLIKARRKKAQLEKK